MNSFDYFRAVPMLHVSPVNTDAVLPNHPRLPSIPFAIHTFNWYFVTFKAGRTGAYYTLTNSSLQIREGDIVIVQGDKSSIDIGKVTRCNISIADMYFLKFKQLIVRKKALLDSGAIQTFNRHEWNFFGGGLKRIERLATDHEVYLIKAKANYEIDALNDCRKKLNQNYANRYMDSSTVMWPLDCEAQFDRSTITFYYRCNRKVIFNNLIKDLYKTHKTRIWLSIIPGEPDDQLKNENQLDILQECGDEIQNQEKCYEDRANQSLRNQLTADVHSTTNSLNSSSTIFTQGFYENNSNTPPTPLEANGSGIGSRYTITHTKEDSELVQAFNNMCKSNEIIQLEQYYDDQNNLNYNTQASARTKATRAVDNLFIISDYNHRRIKLKT